MFFRHGSPPRSEATASIKGLQEARGSCSRLARRRCVDEGRRALVGCFTCERRDRQQIRFLRLYGRRPWCSCRNRGGKQAAVGRLSYQALLSLNPLLTLRIFSSSSLTRLVALRMLDTLSLPLVQHGHRTGNEVVVTAEGRDSETGEEVQRRGATLLALRKAGSCNKLLEIARVTQLRLDQTRRRVELHAARGMSAEDADNGK